MHQNERLHYRAIGFAELAVMVDSAHFGTVIATAVFAVRIGTAVTANSVFAVKIASVFAVRSGAAIVIAVFEATIAAVIFAGKIERPTLQLMRAASRIALLIGSRHDVDASEPYARVAIERSRSEGMDVDRRRGSCERLATAK